MTISPDELIGAIKYELVANGCKYPIDFETHVEGDFFHIEAVIFWQEDKSDSPDPTLGNPVSYKTEFYTHDFPIHRAVDPDFFMDEVIQVTKGIQHFINEEQITL